jgi:hypothetical protein
MAPVNKGCNISSKCISMVTDTQCTANNFKEKCTSNHDILSFTRLQVKGRNLWFCNGCRVGKQFIISKCLSSLIFILILTIHLNKKIKVIKNQIKYNLLYNIV